MRFSRSILEAYDRDFFYEKFKKYLVSIGEPELDKKHHVGDICTKLKMRSEDLIRFLMWESVDHKIGMHVILNEEDQTVYFVKIR